MDATIVDMPKVTQMLDAGWSVRMQKNGMGSYEAQAYPPNSRVRDRTAKLLRDGHEAVDGQTLTYEPDYDWHEDGFLMTDDFTPEQALTRLAYKAVDGTII